ncbi:PAS domain S-box protein [Herbaspirillum sp. GCM10030257]|uniref:PAS domain S-box protein n=1 Tax=Herbaspirillum sp. GCM10030257 TaxID=3273393 RepID=UPI003611F203
MAPLNLDGIPAGLRQLADSASILFWMSDCNDVCTYLNQSAYEVLGEQCSLPTRIWAQFMHPDDRQRLSPLIVRAKQEKREYQLEYRIVKSDGSVRWVMHAAAPRISATGVYEGYMGAIVDISAQRESLAKLAKSEATYRLVTDNSSDIISHHAADTGEYLYVSPSVTRILGYGQSQMLGTKVYDYVHPDDINTIRDEVARQVLGASDVALVEFRIRDKAGAYRWFGTTLQVLVDPLTGVKLGAVAVSRDVTAERQAKEDIRKREERFRSLTALSSDWYWETDEEGRFTFISDGLYRLWGTLPADVIGKTRTERAADPAQPGLLEYRARVDRREPFKDLHYSTFVAIKGAVRHSSISGEPVFENEVFKGYRGIGRDITDEIEVANRLAQLAEENKALIENSLDILALLDENGTFLRVNDAVRDALGFEPHELIGRQYGEFLHPEDADLTKLIDAGLRSGDNTVRDFENRWIKKDGSIGYLSLAVRWSERQKLMYATGRDVTERYQTQRELQKSKDRLAAIVESIGDAFFTLDRNWRAIYVNEKTARFIGRNRDELIGQILWEVVPEVLDSSIMTYYRQVMETGKRAFFETYWPPSHAWIEIRVYPNEDGISVYFHDITARREAENTIRASEQRFRDVIEMTPAGYILTDAEGALLDVNPALCDIAGYQEAELIGHNISVLFPVSPFGNALSTHDGMLVIHAKEAVIRHKNGGDVFVLVNANIDRDPQGNGRSITAFVTNITERKQVESRLEQLATHDTLTGLPNRALLNERLQHMLEIADQNGTVAVFFLDLDSFKEINDSLGHTPGDMLLCEVAQRLRSNLRPGDIVARLGGDEFVVAARCTKGAVSATRIAEKLISAFAEPVHVDGHEVFARASIGISMYPQDGASKEVLCQNADTAMYQAKSSGRNCYRFFKEEMSIQAKERMTLENSLYRALERNELELHYQPRLDLQSMTVVGMEALIRWNHPHLGRVSPLDFIPIAEERGLINEIGKWVLEHACMETQRLTNKLGHALRVSVNLSAIQLRNKHLIEHVTQALQHAGLHSSQLELELTESALIEDMKQSADAFRELKKLGISLAVDDFGTGYSGLAYLGHFPLDVLKLDRSFVNQQDNDNGNFRVIKAFIDMAHSLDLSVVAEGVEREETLQYLRSVDCDEAQGYLFARPLAAHELEEFLVQALSLRATGVAALN